MKTYNTYSEHLPTDRVEGMEAAQAFIMDELEQIEDTLLDNVSYSSYAEAGDKVKGLRLMLDDVLGELNDPNGERL
jgi:hypothetical protein